MMSDDTKQNGSKALALAGDLRTLSDFFKERKASLSAAAATHINPDRLAKIAIRCVSMTPKLRECTIESVFRSVLMAAELGLEPGSALGEAYLVPYQLKDGKGICQLIPGYRGFANMAYRSGLVKIVRAHVVFKDDEFDYEFGMIPDIKHKPSLSGSKKADEITHAYSVIELLNGGSILDVMAREEIETTRKSSKAQNSGPWFTHYHEMCRKTVCRRALKYAPMSIELSKAVALDNAVDTGDFSALEFEHLDPFEEELQELPEAGKAATKGNEAVKSKLASSDLKPVQEVLTT